MLELLEQEGREGLHPVHGRVLQHLVREVTDLVRRRFRGAELLHELRAALPPRGCDECYMYSSLDPM